MVFQRTDRNNASNMIRGLTRVEAFGPADRAAHHGSHRAAMRRTGVSAPVFSVSLIVFVGQSRSCSSSSSINGGSGGSRLSCYLHPRK